MSVFSLHRVEYNFKFLNCSVFQMNRRVSNSRGGKDEAVIEGVDGKTAKAFTQRLRHDVVPPLAFLSYYLKMSACHCYSCSSRASLSQCCLSRRAEAPSQPISTCRERLKEIPVSSLEQSSHIKKK